MQSDPTVLIVGAGVIAMLVGAWYLLRSFLDEGRKLRDDIKGIVTETVRAEIAPIAVKVDVHSAEISLLRAAKSDAFQRISIIEGRS